MNQRRKLRSKDLAQRTGGRVSASELRGRLTQCGAVDDEFLPTGVAVEMRLAEEEPDGRRRWVVDAIVDFALRARAADNEKSKLAAMSAPRPKSARAPRTARALSTEARRIAAKIQQLEEAGRDKDAMLLFDSIELDDPALALLVADAYDQATS